MISNVSKLASTRNFIQPRHSRFVSSTSLKSSFNVTQKTSLFPSVTRSFTNSSAVRPISRSNASFGIKNLTSFRSYSTFKPEEDQHLHQEHADEQVHLESLVIEVNQSNFQQGVVSSKVPVILNCYADWAEPCKQITQQLLQQVTNAEGAIRLGMLNVDRNEKLAEALSLSEVPTVLALHNGKFVDGFKGPKTDAEVAEFVGNLLKKGGSDDVAKILSEAEEFLNTNNTQAAASVYQQLLNRPLLKAEAVAIAGLVRVALAEGKQEDANQLVQHLKTNFPKELTNPEVKKAVVAYELFEQSSGVSSDIQSLIDKTKENPNDLKAKHDLAVAYMGIGKPKDALEVCFEIMKKDKTFNNGEAKQMILKLFEALGPKDDAVKAGKKRLTNLLYV